MNIYIYIKTLHDLLTAIFLSISQTLHNPKPFSWYFNKETSNNTSIQCSVYQYFVLKSISKWLEVETKQNDNDLRSNIHTKINLTRTFCSFEK